MTATYERDTIIESNQWPPVKDHFYVNLALVTSELMLRSDTFSRTTIRGSVDDIYKRKEPIGFEKVFPEKLSSVKHYVSLIEGRPGSGKSTLITKVSKDWADGKILKDIEIFLLVRLRRFVNKDSLTLKDILGTYCHNPTVVDAIHDKITREGGKGVCFGFDGLDEYSSKLTPESLVTKLIHGNLLPRAAVFLTSRPATSERFRRETILSQNIEIIGFLEEEIIKYVKSYYKEDADGKVKAQGLISYINDHPNIKRMCYLPLHIAMIVFLYNMDPESRSRLPKTETDLYFKFTLHTLYRSWIKDLDEEDDPDDIELHEFDDLPPNKKKIFKEVCKLAYMATIEQKQMFTGKEIIKLAGLPEVPKKREFDSVGLLTVDRMIADSSLLTKTFSFLHLTHQEFLTAVHLVNYLPDEEQLATVQKQSAKTHMWSCGNSSVACMQNTWQNSPL